MLKDYAKLAVGNLTKRKLRSWLTMMGIFIGISLLVALVSLGQGLQKSVNDEFDKLGADKLFISAKSGFAAPGSSISTIQLDQSDVKVVEKSYGVEDALGYHFGQRKVEVDHTIVYTYVMTWILDNQLWDDFMSQYDLIAGRKLKDGDDDKAMLGYTYYAGDKFDHNLKLRDKIYIQDKEFRVVGFYESIGNSGDDMNVYITKKAYDDLFDVGDEVAQIIARSEPGQDPKKVADTIKKNLRRHRNVDEGKEDFDVQTADDLMGSFATILNIVQLFLFSIAAISLAVGGVGITNTMYTAVLERTKEIGIMKAIGAKNSTVVTLFLIESGLLGLAGGAIGIAIGIGISKTVELIIHSTGNTIINAYFPWYLTVGALMFSYVVGTASGLMPALQAAREKPVDALRYE